MTVQLDVTRFRAMLERKGLKFYPSFIWCVSHTILSHPAFRMGVDSEGQPGTYDRMHPNYTVFHEDDHTFSDLWTEHNESFPVFYQAFLSDVATYGTRAWDESPGRSAGQLLLHLLRPLAVLYRLCLHGPRGAAQSVSGDHLWKGR